jgi:hypothetical protein
MRLADKLIAGGKAARVLICPIAMGGSSIAHWGADGQHTDRIITICERLRLHGLTPTWIIWQQGESDHNTQMGVYSQRLLDTIGVFRAQGVNCRFYITTSTMLNGNISANIQTAQSVVVNNADNIFQGPNSDTLCPAATHRTDNTHYNTTGGDTIATAYANLLPSL